MSLDDSQKTLTLTISTLSIIKVLGILLAFWFLYVIRDILMILFVSIILASVISPVADCFQKKKIPRGVSVLIVYIILIVLISLSVVLIIPPINEQIKELTNNPPLYLEKILKGFSNFKEHSEMGGDLGSLELNSKLLKGGLVQVTGGVFSVISGIFGGVISFFVVLVITFYFTVEKSAAGQLFKTIAPIKYQPYLMQLMSKMQKKIGYWLRAQLILCLIIGVFSYIGLLILGVKYALVLGLIAGLTEIIPYLGPILGAIPAVILAFTQSPFLALLVIILYLVVQQMESNILVPKIMQRAVGLHPVVCIIVLLIGGRIAGVTGVLLAVPVATAGSVLIKDFFSQIDFEKEEEIKASKGK